MALRHWFQFIRFSHTLFALPFAAVGYTMGLLEVQHFAWQTLLLVVLCMVSNRNAAMAFNRLVDLRIDAHNPRTAHREIPQRLIRPRAALIFVVVNSLLFVAFCAALNRLTFILAPVALLTVFLYSYTKRFTWLCHYILGIGLALAPIGAFLAVTGHFSFATLVLGAGVMTWVAGFDIIYALQDEEFDRRHHLYSIPSRFGTRRSVAIARITHFFTIGCFAFYTALYMPQAWLAYAALLLFAAVLCYQHRKFYQNTKGIDGNFMLINSINSTVFGCLLVLILLFF